MRQENYMASLENSENHTGIVLYDGYLGIGRARYKFTICSVKSPNLNIEKSCLTYELVRLKV